MHFPACQRTSGAVPAAKDGRKARHHVPSALRLIAASRQPRCFLSMGNAVFVSSHQRRTTASASSFGSKPRVHSAIRSSSRIVRSCCSSKGPALRRSQVERCLRMTGSAAIADSNPCMCVSSRAAAFKRRGGPQSRSHRDAPDPSPASRRRRRAGQESGNRARRHRSQGNHARSREGVPCGAYRKRPRR
jgi:hypothetical protein